MKRILSFLACALLILSYSLACAVDIADWQKRADAGDVLAMAIIGEAYAIGDGISQDYHKANAYWLKAINHPKWNTMDADVRGEVYFNLGVSYAKGRGFRQDYHKAVEYFRKAADLGYAQAMYNLGASYYNGDGVRQDKRKAKEYYGMACDHGYQKGCDEYRDLNEKGY